MKKKKILVVIAIIVAGLMTYLLYAYNARENERKNYQIEACGDSDGDGEIDVCG